MTKVSVWLRYRAHVRAKSFDQEEPAAENGRSQVWIRGVDIIDYVLFLSIISRCVDYIKLNQLYQPYLL